MNKKKTISALLAWLETNIPKNTGMLVPVSGGSDSALCFWLCNQILKEQTKGVYIGQNLRRKDWFDSVGTVSLDDVKFGGANPEVQRWAHFLGVCLQENCVLVGSRNLTESRLGTFSNASRVTTFLPLGGLWKHEVMELCDHVGVPSEITESSRQADPECGRPEKLADIAYESVDRFLQEELGLKADEKLPLPSKEQHKYLEEVYRQNSYKANLPLVGPASASG